MDITSLGIAVDSSQVVQASKDLDQLAESGDKAGTSMKRLSSESQSWTQRQSAYYQTLKQTRSAQVELNQDQEKFMSALQRQVDTLGMSKAKLLEFKAAELDVSAQAKTLIAQLEAGEAALKKTGSGAHGAAAGLGTFSLQSSIARRELATMTRELARGDFNRFGSSLSIFAQSTNLLSAAMTPLGMAVTATVAGVGALAYAYEQATGDAKNFNDAMVLTGGYAGVTQGEFSLMAKEVADATDTTVASAREIGTELLKSGNVSTGALKSTTTAVVTFARLSGQSADQVAKQFGGMAADVSRGVDKLDDKYHFLTSTQREHIRVLDEQGDHTGALRDAMDAMNDKMGEQARELSGVAWAWNEVKVAADRAFDSMKSAVSDQGAAIGAAQLKARLANVATYQNDPDAREKLGLFGYVRAGMDAQIKPDLESAYDNASEKAASEKREKDAQQATVRMETARKNLDAMLVKYRSDEEKMNAEIAAVYRDAEVAGSQTDLDKAEKAEAAIRAKYTKKGGGNNDRQVAMADLNFELDQIKRAGDEKLRASNNTEKLLEAQRSADLIDEQAYYDKKKALVQDQATIQQNAISQQITLLQQQSFTGKTAAQDEINNQRKILDLQAQLTRSRQDAATELETLAIRQKKAADDVARSLYNAVVAAQQYVDTIARQNQRDLDGIGQGNWQREIDTRKNQRDDQHQSRLDSLNEQLRAKQITDKQWQAYVEVENQAHQRALAQDDAYYKAKLEKLQDWHTGANEALANYLNDVDNAAGRAEQVLGDALGGSGSAFADAVWDRDMSGFKSLGDKMGKQILAGIWDQQIGKNIAEQLQSAIGDKDSLFGQALGGLFSNKGTGENWLAALGLGGKGKGTSSAVADLSGATSATAAATAQTALASSASAAAAALAGFTAAVSSASVSSGGSSLFSYGSAASSGFGTGSAFGNMDLGGFFADGGSPPLNKVSVVGERGAELFVPKQPGTVIPNEVLQALGAGANSRSGGDVFNISVPVTGQVDNRTRNQIGSDVGMQVRNSRRFQ